MTLASARGAGSRWPLGGALGAVLRWWLGDAVPDGAGFPWTTFAINVTGSLALALAARPSPPCAGARSLAAALGPGLLGGYTTLSAYSEQARALLADGQTATAAASTCSARSPPAWSRSPSVSRLVPAGRRRRVRGRGRRRVTPLLVALGAALGAPLRFCDRHQLDDGAVPARARSLVNVAGSFLLGLFVGRRRDRRTALALLGTGFCGGFTTYSAFAVQTHRLGPRPRRGVRRRDDRRSRSPRARSAFVVGQA